MLRTLDIEHTPVEVNLVRVSPFVLACQFDQRHGAYTHLLNYNPYGNHVGEFREPLQCVDVLRLCRCTFCVHAKCLVNGLCLNRALKVLLFSFRVRALIR